MNRLMLRIFSLFLVLCSLSFQAQANESQTYSRGDLVARALGGSPLIAAAEAEMDVFEAKLRHAQRWWVPRLNIQTLISVIPGQRGDAVEGTTGFDEWGPYSRTDATVGMALFTFGKVSSLKEMAQAGVDVSEAKRVMARLTVERQVDQALTAVLLGRALLELLEDGKEKVQRARTRLEAMEEEDSDDYDPTDKLRLRLVDVELDEHRLDATSLLDQGLIALRLLCGLEPSDPLNLSDKLSDYGSVVSDSEAASVVIAKANRPELKSLSSALQVGKAAIAYAKASLLPNLVFGGFVRYAYAPTADDQASPFAYDPFNIVSGGAGLLLQWNLDIPGSLSAIDEASGRNRQLLAHQRALHGKTEMEVRNAWKGLTQADARRNLARTGTKAARGWLTAKADLFDAGFADFGEVSKAVKTYYERRVKEIYSEYQQAVSRVRLAEAVGLPLK